MTLFQSLLLASSLLRVAVAAPSLAARGLSCPASNNTLYTVNSNSYSIECGVDRYAGNMADPNGQFANTLEACISQCEARAGCVLVDYVPGPKACYIKSGVGHTIANSGVIGALLVTSSTGSSSTTTKGASSTIAMRSSVTTTMTSSITTKTKLSTTLSTMASSTSAAPTSTSTSTGAGKRGLCFNKAPMTSFFGGSGSKVTWMYDWDQTVYSGANSGLQYIPMLWNNDASRTSSWSANAKTAISAGADHLLGFNEPDLNSQANMDLSTAVSAWKTYIQPFAGQVKLVSPAVTNGGSPGGLTYLENFISECTGCQIDACAIHWYDSATNIAYFKNYIPEAYAACGNKPIWITEFGASGTEAEIETFLKTVLPWLDNLDYVERYAYFYDGASTDGTYLVDSAGTGLSTIGSIFNTY